MTTKTGRKSRRTAAVRAERQMRRAFAALQRAVENLGDVLATLEDAAKAR